MSLQAGTGMRDVSPTKPMFLCGFPHVPRTSTGTHDPLKASALCLENGSRAILLVAVDILFISPLLARKIRRRISRETRIPESHILVSCSHTHSGPVTCDVLEWGPSPVVPPCDLEYMQYLEDGIVNAAAAAARTRRAANLAWTTAHIDGVGGNRHDPEGPRDPEVGILAVRDRASGMLSALSVTYSMHPTVLHEDSTLVSSDFPGFTRRHLGEQFGSQLTVLYHNGPEGNQSPRYDVAGQTFAEAERLGRKLGEAILASVRQLDSRSYQDNPVLGGRLAPVTLPRRVLPSVSEAECKLGDYRRTYRELQARQASKPVVRTAQCDVFGAEETLYLAQCRESGLLEKVLANYDPMEVQTLRIGDTFVCGFPGELFVEFGLALKRQAAAKTIAVTLVNGDAQGYIVTPDAVRAGRYETNNCVFAPEAGDIMVQAALHSITELQEV